MSPKRSYDIEGIELRDDHYTVEQSLIRNKYKALDADGDVVLRGKQKMFKMKEQFPFTDADGEEVFEVKAGGIIDVAGDYVLTDAQTGEDIALLDNDFSILQDTWTIRDPDHDGALAQLDSRGALYTLARNYVPFGNLIPHKYEITDPEGGHVGTVAAHLSFRDRYDIDIDDASDVPKEPVVAAAMVIDAIKNN